MLFAFRPSLQRFLGQYQEFNIVSENTPKENLTVYTAHLDCHNKAATPVDFLSVDAVRYRVMESADSVSVDPSPCLVDGCLFTPSSYGQCA